MVNESVAERTLILQKKKVGESAKTGTPMASDLGSHTDVSLEVGDHYAGPAAGVCTVVWKN